MKKIFFFTAIAFVMLSSSCKKEVTALSQDRTATARISSSGGAVTFSSVEVAHHNGDQLYNPCTNELMNIYGDVQFRTHGVTNDNNSITTLNTSLKGVKAIGETGRVYAIVGAGALQWSNYSNGVFTFKLRYTNHFITPGGKNNFIEGQTFYLKVDASGNTTYIIDPVSDNYCQ